MDKTEKLFIGLVILVVVVLVSGLVVSMKWNREDSQFCKDKGGVPLHQWGDMVDCKVL